MGEHSTRSSQTPLHEKKVLGKYTADQPLSQLLNVQNKIRILLIMVSVMLK